MSNGFNYRELSESKGLNTMVNHWLHSELEAKFGKLPVVLHRRDLSRLQKIVDEMHEVNQPSMLPLLDLLQSGRSVLLDRDGWEMPDN
jgi:hypothetical protein